MTTKETKPSFLSPGEGLSSVKKFCSPSGKCVDFCGSPHQSVSLGKHVRGIIKWTLKLKTFIKKFIKLLSVLLFVQNKVSIDFEEQSKFFRPKSWKKYPFFRFINFLACTRQMSFLSSSLNVFFSSSQGFLSIHFELSKLTSIESWNGK